MQRPRRRRRARRVHDTTPRAGTPPRAVERAAVPVIACHYYNRRVAASHNTAMHSYIAAHTTIHSPIATNTTTHSPTATHKTMYPPPPSTSIRPRIPSWPAHLPT